MTNARPFLYGLKDIDRHESLHNLREKKAISSLCTQFFDALDQGNYAHPIFEDDPLEAIAHKLSNEEIRVADGLPKCDGLRRGIADIMASHYLLRRHFPKFKLIVDDTSIFVDEKIILADVMVLFSTEGLPVGRNGEGGLCVLRWIRDGRIGEWFVRDGMHMQGSNGF